MESVTEGVLPYRLLAEQSSNSGSQNIKIDGNPTDAVVFFGISLVLGIACRHLLRGTRVPYTVALLVIGIAMGSIEYGTSHQLGKIGDGIRIWANIDPDLLLAVFLPALLFESSFAMEVHQIKRCMVQMLLLAGPGVLISTFFLGSALKLTFAHKWSWKTSLLLGGLLSATDPVAVVALLKELGASKKLSTIIEGESLMNDGTAIVVYQLFYRMVLGKSFGWGAIVKFLTQVSLGAVGMGLAFGVVSVLWLGFIFNDTVIEISLTLAVSYLAYFTAQEGSDISGVLTVMTLGMFYAAVARTAFKGASQQSLHYFWEMVAYIANTLIFILSGVVIAEGVLSSSFKFENHGNSWGYLILLYVFVQVSRIVVVGILYPFLRYFGYGLEWKEAIILIWSGLRGAVALSLSLSVKASESDDDHEELFAAASSARNASNLACSGLFWKKMETVFSSLSSEDMSYLKQQLSFAEELEVTLSQMFGDEYSLMGVLVHKEVPDSCDGQESYLNQENGNYDALHEGFDMEKSGKVSPLYQRLLSALIEEDDSDEFYHHCEGKNLSLHYASDDSHCGSCNLIDIEPKDRDRMESEVESKADFLSQKSCLLDRLSCDKSAASNTFRNPSMSSSLHSNGQWLEDDFSHSNFGLVSEICSNDMVQQQPRERNVPGFSSSDFQYQLICLDDKLLLELQSIDLYPETLPALADGEEVINQDVMELKEGLYQQITRKKKNLKNIDEVIQKWRAVERRNIENCAMDQLIEMAYRKRMACRGSQASKTAARKVSRQVALGFMKRTLARCRKFEGMGSSYFSKAVLQDVLFSAPPSGNDAKSVDCVRSGTASNTCNEASNNQTEARGSGAISSTYECYDRQCDTMHQGSTDAFSKRGIILTKMKREVLIDEVVGCASSNLGGDTGQGKRSKRGNKSTYNSMSVLDSSFNSEHKTKLKPKNKNNNHSSTSGNKRRQEVVEPCCEMESCKEDDDEELENLEKHELEIDDANQDLNNWFNGLQDHDSMGLEIPMDDLSDLNMLL